MGQFLTPLKMEQLEESTPDSPAKFKLLAPLVYESTSLKQLVVVPEGFVTDLASVPRLPVVYLVTGGLGNAAACVHDFLYSQPHLPSESACTPVTRAQADLVLRGAIIDGMTKNLGFDIARKTRDLWAAFTDVVKITYYTSIAFAMYYGVRIGGTSHWKD